MRLDKLFLFVFLHLSVHIAFGQTSIKIDSSIDGVAFIGSYNKLAIDRPTEQLNQLIVTTNNGTVKSDNGVFYIIPDRVSDVIVVVSSKASGQTREIGRRRFVVECPKPQAYFCSRIESAIPGSDVKQMVNKGFQLFLNGCGNFPYRGYVFSYKIAVIRSGSYLINERFEATDTIGATFKGNQKVNDMFNAIKSGDKLMFSDILYKGYRGECSGTANKVELSVW